MPFWLIGIVARSGVPAGFQKAVAWLLVGVFVILIVGGSIVAWNSYRVRDNTAFADSRDKDVTIEAANRVINATYEADARQAERDDVFANSQKELRDEVRTKGTDAPVGPAVSAVLERLRREQAAARDRNPAR